MAETNECFNIGSNVCCVTCFNENLQGEVLAFDPHVKVLTLKAEGSSGRSNVCDIRMVNLSYVSQVTVLSEAAPAPLPTLPSLNLTKLRSREERSIREKQRLVQAVQSGVGIDGQKLFLYISRTMDDVSWQGSNILVMNQVLITSPYTPENVRENRDSKELNKATAVAHIRKIVEKFYSDQNAPVLNNGANASAVTVGSDSNTSSTASLSSASDISSVPQ